MDPPNESWIEMESLENRWETANNQLEELNERLTREQTLLEDLKLHPNKKGEFDNSINDTQARIDSINDDIIVVLSELQDVHKFTDIMAGGMKTKEEKLLVLRDELEVAKQEEESDVVVEDVVEEDVIVEDVAVEDVVEEVIEKQDVIVEDVVEEDVIVEDVAVEGDVVMSDLVVSDVVKEKESEKAVDPEKKRKSVLEKKSEIIKKLDEYQSALKKEDALQVEQKKKADEEAKALSKKKADEDEVMEFMMRDDPVSETSEKDISALNSLQDFVTSESSPEVPLGFLSTTKEKTTKPKSFVLDTASLDREVKIRMAEQDSKKKAAENSRGLLESAVVKDDSQREYIGELESEIERVKKDEPTKDISNLLKVLEDAKSKKKETEREVDDLTQVAVDALAGSSTAELKEKEEEKKKKKSTPAKSNKE